MGKRLDTALKSLGPEVVKAITSRKNDFGQRIAATRNNLTHKDEKTKGNVMQPRDLYLAAEKLRYFLTVLVFRMLGIPPEETIEAMQEPCR